MEESVSDILNNRGMKINGQNGQKIEIMDNQYNQTITHHMDLNSISLSMFATTKNARFWILN